MKSNLMLSPISLPRALRFRSLVANKDKRETRMTGEEAQGSMERRKNRGNLARFLLSIFLCAQIYIRHLHIFHNTPCLPPKILHNLCFSLLLGITAVPREIERNAYTKFGGGGANKVHFGRWACGELRERETSKNEAATFTEVSLFCPRRA